MDIKKLYELKGKVALITGASKGIGEALAHLFAQAGAEVIVSSRKQEAVDSVASAIQKQGGKAHAIACNVGDPKQVSQLVEKSLKACGKVNILINNAAANPVFGPVLETDLSAFDKIIDVNLKGAFLLSKALYPSMKAAGGGSIINISSIGGIRPEQGLGIYSVSKAALISLSQVLAKELGRDGIRVNSICPGLIKTKFSEALWSNDKIMQSMMKMLPIQRVGEPDEIAAMALFLASDAAAYTTGAVFTADGGFTI